MEGHLPPPVPAGQGEVGFSSVTRLGQWKEAVGHFQDLLRINPNDNQGIRFRLFNCSCSWTKRRS